MNKASLRTIVVLILGVIGFAGKALAAGQYFKVDYPASTASNELQVAGLYSVIAVNSVGLQSAPSGQSP